MISVTIFQVVHAYLLVSSNETLCTSYSLLVYVLGIPLNLMLHHLCSMICLTVIRLSGFVSSILRSNDKASVSNLLHGVIVIHELSLFHLTNSAQPVVGSSHGSSVNAKITSLKTIFDESYYI